MHLIQLLLPVNDNDGRPYGEHTFRLINTILTRRFGGVTAFSRAPAKGAWMPEEGTRIEHDDVIIVEVMSETLDRDWWARFRRQLETDLHQKEIVIRAEEMIRL